MLKNLSKKKKVGIILASVLIIVLIIIPMVAKHYINNNGKELIGRKVNLESLSINYFTGAVNIGDFTIYEENNKDSFLFLKKLHINPGVIACISQNYTIENLTIEGLKCNTILTDTTFNFNSIISHFSDTTTVEDNESSATIKYKVEKINIVNSYLSYYDKNLESKIALNDFNLSLLNGVSWDNSNINVLSNFKFTTGGKVDSKLNFNIDKGIYNLDLKSNKINLDILLPYLKDFMLVKKLAGSLNTNLFIKGNTEEPANIDITGAFETENIEIIDTSSIKVMALKNMKIIADSINPYKDIYQLSAVKLDLPYARYEMFPTTDNFTQLFKLSDSTEVATTEEIESNVFVMIKDYVVETLHGIKASNFSIDTVAITNVEAHYFDHTMLQPFKYVVSKTDLVAYDVKSDADSLIVDFSALLNNKGTLKANGILHPKKPEDVTMSMSIDEMAMQDLSPYFHQYVAHPVVKGDFNMNCNISVLDKQLKSENDLMLNSFKLGKKQKHDEAYNLPIKMGVAMLKDREGNIVLNIPVEGDLADPKYKVWKTIGRIFKELILKAASSPYNLVAGAIETDEESTKRITLNHLIDSLNDRHHVKLDNLSKVLTEKPALVLLIDPYYNLNIESEKIAEFLAKSEFTKIGVKPSYSNTEFNKITSVATNDSLFISYINSKVGIDNTELSIKEKYNKMYSSVVLKNYVETYVDEKLAYIHNYLISKGVKETQLKKSSLGEVRYDQTTNKNVQYHLLFDVGDTEEE